MGSSRRSAVGFELIYGTSAKGFQARLAFLVLHLYFGISVLSRRENIKIDCSAIKKLSHCSSVEDDSAAQEENSAPSSLSCRECLHGKHVYLRVKNAANLQSPEEIPSIGRELSYLTFNRQHTKSRIGKGRQSCLRDCATSENW
jgi:hypothetical protein